MEKPTNEELVIRFQNGDEAAFEELIRNNYGMISRSTKDLYSFGIRNVEFDDLWQEAIIGMYHAAKKYNPASGNRFMTYAFFWMRERVQRFIANCGTTIRVPVKVHEDIKKYRLLLKDIFQNYPEATPEMRRELIAQKMNTTAENVERLETISNTVLQIYSSDTPISEQESTIMEIAEDDGESQESYVFYYKPLKDTISEVLSTLTDRERKIIEMKYGLYDGKEYSFREIAREFQISDSRVRQIEIKAFQKICSCDNKALLEPFLNEAPASRGNGNHRVKKIA